MSEMSRWSGPGIVLIFLKPRGDSSKVSPEALENWLDLDYVPLLQKTGGVQDVRQYKAANLAYNKQHVLVCEVSDLASIQAGEVQGFEGTSRLSQHHESIGDHIQIDSRIYSFVQLYETSKHRGVPATTIMLAMMEPAQGGGAELDAWYRDEHNQQMSEQSGWLRTTRFSLLHQHMSSGEGNEKLTFLAIHEFDEGNQLGAEVQALEPMSDWTRKVMSEAHAIDAAIFHEPKKLGNDDISP